VAQRCRFPVQRAKGLFVAWRGTGRRWFGWLGPVREQRGQNTGAFPYIRGHTIYSGHDSLFLSRLFLPLTAPRLKRRTVGSCHGDAFSISTHHQNAVCLRRWPYLPLRVIVLYVQRLLVAAALQ